MSAEMFLTLFEGTSVSIDRARALTMTEDEFADFYLGCVHSPIKRRQRKRDARSWAREQVRLRKEALASPVAAPSERP